MRLVIFFLFMNLLIPSVFAQNQFRIQDGSKNYIAELTAICENDTCEGPGEVRLISRKTGKLFQTFRSDDLYMFLDDPEGHPSVNVVELYGEQSPVIFDDFNFDGYEDIAIRNGNQSGYGGPSYDVYVFNVTRKKFVKSAELTDLAFSNLGMFQVDSESKRIRTFSKSGCCWHQMVEYEVDPEKGLVEVLVEENDARGGEKIIQTTRRFINGIWVETETTAPMPEHGDE